MGISTLDCAESQVGSEAAAESDAANQHGADHRPGTPNTEKRNKAADTIRPLRNDQPSLCWAALAPTCRRRRSGQASLRPKGSLWDEASRR